MGSANLFRYNSELDAFTLYHIVNESSGGSSIGGGPALPALGHALAGSIGSATAKAITYPIDLVVTRLQVQKQLRAKGETKSAARDADAEYVGLLDAARKIYKNEGGLAAFFTGCPSNIGKGIVDSFLFFLAYSWLRDFEMRKRNTKTLSVPVDLAIGVAAGSFSKLVTTPIQNVVTRQQTAALVAARDPNSSSPSEADTLSIKDIVAQIHSERGIAGFWSGYSAATILTINPAITFAVDNILQGLLPKSRRENPGPYLTFIMAALSKAIATSITYPVQLAKSRAQAGGHRDDDDDDGDDNGETLAGSAASFVEKPASSTTLDRRQAKKQLHKILNLLSGQYAIYVSLRKLYRKEGLAGLYSGLEGDILKGFLSHGLTMMMKQSVHTAVIQLYYILLKLTRRWPEELKKAQEKAQEGLVEASKIVAEGTQKVVEETQKGAGRLVDEAQRGTQKLVEETKKITGVGE